MSSPRKRGSIGHRGHSQVRKSRVAALHSAGGVTRSGSGNHRGRGRCPLPFNPHLLPPQSPAGLTGEFANPAIIRGGRPPRPPSSRSFLPVPQRRDGLTANFQNRPPDSAHRPYRFVKSEGDPDSSAIVRLLCLRFDDLMACCSPADNPGRCLFYQGRCGNL